jgi:hypothetical protein
MPVAHVEGIGLADGRKYAAVNIFDLRNWRLTERGARVRFRIAAQIALVVEPSDV